MSEGQRLILQTDLKQFYDRVSPELLNKKLQGVLGADDDAAFRGLANKLFSWNWVDTSKARAKQYAQASGLGEYETIALPQGLVAAGFLSNIVLIDFDSWLRDSIGMEIVPGVWLKDACRYVDDLRLALVSSPGVTALDAKMRVSSWLASGLTRLAPGLLLSEEKTKIAEFGGQEQQLLRQSRKMERIQAAVSGGFDAAGGEEVIQAIEALVRSQVPVANLDQAEAASAFKAVPDVGAETIGRFAAGRFRTTYRSLRPLLESRSLLEALASEEESFRRSRLTQEELDEEARAFALTLVERWVGDPSNVRLLRVALDLWPSRQLLSNVLDLFQPYLSGKKKSRLPREVVYYCVGEILRAGATETGFVEDEESFPSEVNIDGYRSLLSDLAAKLAFGKGKDTPWFVRQQAQLYLAVHAPRRVTLPKRRLGENRYRRMLRFLVGEHSDFSSAEFAIMAIVARRSFLDLENAVGLVSASLNQERFAEIAARDVDFARDLYRATKVSISGSSGIAEDIGIAEWSGSGEMHALKDVVASDPMNALRNEVGVLSFALAFLKAAKRDVVPAITTPSTVHVTMTDVGRYKSVREVAFRSVPQASAYRSIYAPPNWASPGQKWRFQLGYLLRYILTARVDFTLPVRPASWKEGEPVYRPTRGHWFQRTYGFYSGHEAFGDDWLPISQFTQDLLFSLLIWPGCRGSDGAGDELNLEVTEARVQEALIAATMGIGPSTGILMIPVAAPIPGTKSEGRPLRGCVVQTVTPEVADFNAFGPELNDPSMRRKHRNHLSTALAAVEKMLDLRDTHKDQRKRLDWLILPELAVHPKDVRTHLIPFARAYKTAILTGVSYESVTPGGLLVNSALWIIPRMIPSQGLQTVIRRQGKQHLSPMETPFNAHTKVIDSFRPCQWLIGYEWSSAAESEPLWLTGAVCYDGTDLGLASDLRDRSDVFAIPALNRDVGTFDQMAQALHYHMYQMVIVANNGAFGGSNAHVPRGGPFDRQIFHTHGQPQANISFFEIDDIKDMKNRKSIGFAGTSKTWKHPPAGY
jgi:hypothetical protein